MSLKCSVLKSGFCEITQGFGGSNNHRGLDLVGPNYTIDDIVSYANGTVSMATNGYGNGQGEGVNWAYGNFVKIINDDGTVCLYAHMEYTSVSVGQRVSKGQIIGRMGNSGNSFGGHLHWEYWTHNDYYSNIDPSPYLQPKEPIVLPGPVNRDKNKRQFQVDYNDNLRVRVKPSLNCDVLGILNAGIYDFTEERDAEGYKWVKIGTDMWCACTDMSRILEIEKEIIEKPAETEKEEEVKEPIIEDKEEETKEPVIEEEKNDNSEILDKNNTDTTESEEKEEATDKEPVKEEIEDNNINEKESVLLWIIETIYNFLKKLIKRG